MMSILERVGEYDLRAASAAARKDFGPHGDAAVCVGGDVLDEVVHREFDGLLGSDAHKLWQQASVEAEKALETQHLAEAVQAMLIHARLGRLRHTLVLHSRFHQINRVHGRRAHRCMSSDPFQ